MNELSSVGWFIPQRAMVIGLDQARTESPELHLCFSYG